MAIDTNIKEAIKNIPRQDLEKLLLKAISKNVDIKNYVLVNYVDTTYGEQDLYDKTKKELSLMFTKRYKGFVEELQYAEMLAACYKKIIEFSKVCKNKEYELKLILFVLEIPFSLHYSCFETCFTNFNYRVCLLLNRAIGILQKKLHPDYKMEYEPTLKKYSDFLFKHCDYLDSVQKLKFFS
jgi:hypothetical protein